MQPNDQIQLKVSFVDFHGGIPLIIFLKMKNQSLHSHSEITRSKSWSSMNGLSMFLKDKDILPCC